MTAFDLRRWIGCETIVANRTELKGTPLSRNGGRNSEPVGAGFARFSRLGATTLYDDRQMESGVWNQAIRGGGVSGDSRKSVCQLGMNGTTSLSTKDGRCNVEDAGSNISVFSS